MSDKAKIRAHLQNPVPACSYGMVCPSFRRGMVLAVKRAARPSTKRTEFMDGEVRASTHEPIFMDECGKKPVLSTTRAVYVDGKAGPSTIRAIPVDKWQKKRHPSTKRTEFMDGETGASTQEPIFMDECGKKPVLSFPDFDWP